MQRSGAQLRQDRPEAGHRTARRAAALPAFALLDDGTSIELTILDLSYDGCRAKVPVGLLPNTKLKLAVPRLGQLPAEVRWSEGDVAGLRFFSEAIEPVKPQTPRGHERINIDGEISLRRTGHRHFRCRIFDLTPSGCRVEFVERPKVGDTIWTKFEGLDALETEVRWVEGYLGGVEFKRAIYPAVYDLLLARLGAL